MQAKKKEETPMSRGKDFGLSDASDSKSLFLMNHKLFDVHVSLGLWDLANEDKRKITIVEFEL